MTKAQPVHGADISHHQASVNIAKAKDAGLQFLYHKATEGTSYVDPNYTRRRAEAAKAGLPFGAYHFARPDAGKGDAVAEAKRFIAYAQPKPGDLIPALDLEVQEGLSIATLSKWAEDFSTEVHRLVGVRPIVYCPWDLPSTRSAIRWVPRYNNSNVPPSIRWDIWQFSNGVYGVPDSFPGLGNVDLNTFRPGLTLDQIRIPSIVKESKPVPPKKPAPLRDAFLLHMQHSSMQRTDKPSEKQHDATQVFSRGNHVVTLTEVGVSQNKNGREMIRKAALAQGYHIFMDRYDCGVAVKIPGMKVIDEGYEGPIIKGVAGDHPHIGVAWVTIEAPRIGRATFAALHWMTKNQVHSRAIVNDSLSEQATAFLEKKAAGSAIAFIAGDTNEDDKTGAIFPRSSHWTTCWDEIKFHPDTLDHRTVDVIASYDRDGRVTCTGARRPALGLHSDHKTIEAVYAVAPVKS